MNKIIMLVIWLTGTILAYAVIAKKKEGNMKKALYGLALSFLSALFGYLIGEICGSLNAFNNNKSVGEESFDTHFTDYSNHSESSHYHYAFSVVTENNIDPTCVDAGSYDSVEYCECGYELSRESIEVKQLDHVYRETKTNPSCNKRGFTTYVCSLCGDSYVDDYTELLEHDYQEGVCTRCDSIDPNYIKNYSSEDIMKMLSDSVVISSDGYKEHLGSDSIIVFAEEQHNCFSIGTAVSYNLWNANIQSVVFNISKLKEIEHLSFDIGGTSKSDIADGSSGSMTVEIFIDKTMEDDADYKFDLEASAIPTPVSIDIKDATSLSIRVTNHSGNLNRLVFFNFADGG